MPYYRARINFTRNSIRHLPDEDRRRQDAREVVKFLLLCRDAYDGDSLGREIPDSLVSGAMVERYLAIEPPQAMVIPVFDAIVDEIERSYVLGLLFSALSAANVTVERVLNLLRIELHPFHPGTQGHLVGKGPIENWKQNIDALVCWGYLKDEEFIGALRRQYKVRSKYLHNGPLNDLASDCLVSVQLAYELLNQFLAFPPTLFRWSSGIECLDPSHPIFIAFYRPSIVEEA